MFHVVLVGLPWLGYRRYDGLLSLTRYLGFVTQSARAVPVLFVRLAIVVALRCSRHHCTAFRSVLLIPDNRVHMALTAALPWRRPRIGRAYVLWNQFRETPCAVLTLYLDSLRT
jgi:hypothetical protein